MLVPVPVDDVENPLLGFVDVPDENPLPPGFGVDELLEENPLLGFEDPDENPLLGLDEEERLPDDDELLLPPLEEEPFAYISNDTPRNIMLSTMIVLIVFFIRLSV